METFFLILYLIILFGFVFYIVGKSMIEEEKEAKIEKERKDKINCCICGKHEDGKYICQNCWERVSIIRDELPFRTINTYELILQFRNNLFNQIIQSEHFIPLAETGIQLHLDHGESDSCHF